MIKFLVQRIEFSFSNNQRRSKKSSFHFSSVHSHYTFHRSLFFTNSKDFLIVANPVRRSVKRVVDEISTAALSRTQ